MKKEIFEKCFDIAAKQLDREKQRSKSNIEVPFRRRQFEQWLREQGLKENTVRTEISNLRSMDANAFLFEDDFFEVLETISELNVEKVTISIFKTYEDVLDKWLDAAERGKIEYRVETIKRWVKTLDKYKQFMLGRNEKKFCLLLSNEFVEWESKRVSMRTAKQYVSFIEHLYNIVFANGIYENVIEKLADYDPFLSPDYNEYLDDLDSLIEEVRSVIDQKQQQDENVSSLRNGLTALRAYRDFIHAVDYGEVDLGELPLLVEYHDVQTIYRVLIKNFLDIDLRYTRMYFPVGVLRKLFKSYDDLFPEKRSVQKDFESIVNEFLDKVVVNVASTKGLSHMEFSLNQISSVTFYPMDKCFVTLKKDSLKQTERMNTESMYEEFNGGELETLNGPFGMESLDDLYLEFPRRLFEAKLLECPALITLTKGLEHTSDEEFLKSMRNQSSILWVKELCEELGYLFRGVCCKLNHG